jgi:pentatricopeptide repeat protein
MRVFWGEQGHFLKHVADEGSMCQQVLGDLLSHEAGGVGSPSTYAALMAACEKAGQWDLALALFDKMSSQITAHAPSFAPLPCRVSPLKATSGLRQNSLPCPCQLSPTSHAGGKR